MSTIVGILDGKSEKTYFKLEDLGEDAFIITESIDPAKTELRTEKVKNKEGSKTPETEYFHITGILGDVEKDLSLTFTALKQLAAVMPRNENWRGYAIKFNGTKGTGKNIKYGYSVLGKKEIPQSRHPVNDITDTSGALLADLKKAAGWEDNAFWDMVGNHVKTLGEGAALVEKLKREGRIVQDKNGMWKAV